VQEKRGKKRQREEKEGKINVGSRAINRELDVLISNGDLTVPSALKILPR
jgi:hypothetical protein